MRTRRATNLLWGVVFLALALVFVLRALNQIPDGIYDIFTRAWPALLVLAGLAVFLRQRAPFGSGLALIASLGLVAAVTTLAFSTRAEQERQDYQQDIAQDIGGNVSLLAVNVETLATDVEVLRSLDTQRSITGRFMGSAESRIEVDYSEDDEGRAVFRLREIQPNAFPMLDAIGRGTLRLELPPDIAVDVAFAGNSGDMRFNMSELALERLGIDLRQGNALVTLPAYRPLSPTVAEQPGNLIVRDGNITIFVPQTVAGRFELNRGGSGIEPFKDDTIYNYLVGDVLEAKNYETADIRVRYIVTAPRGLIRLETSEP